MYPHSPNNQKQKIIASFIVIMAVVLVTTAVSAYENKQKSSATTAQEPTASTQTSSTSNTSTPTTTTTQQSSTTDSTSSTSYKDGTYTSSSDYYVPHGSENIKVTVTIKDGTVTDSQIVNSESDHESARFQEDFAAEYKTYVVGKNIGSIHLSYIAGASDTTDGFNTALEQIISQARA